MSRAAARGGPPAPAFGTEGAPAGVRTAPPAAEVAGWADLAGWNRDRHPVGDGRRTVGCCITCLLVNVFARKLFSQVLVSWGRVMRYGSCNSRAPALLAGGVVACPVTCPLVASSRLADALCAVHLDAVDRAVALPAIAVGADDHQSVAPCAVEHPVALVNGQAPATEDWTPWPPPAILSFSVVLSPWRWHRSPGRYANDLGFVFSVEALFYHADGWRVTRLSLTLAFDDISGMRPKEPDPLFGLGGWGEPDPFACRQMKRRTKSRALCARGRNHIQRSCARRTRTTSTL